jgi:hypothetical protein
MDRATRTPSKAAEWFHREPPINRRIQARAAPRPCSCDNVISPPSSWGPQGVLPLVLTSSASGGTDWRKGGCAPQGYQHFPRYGGSLSRYGGWPYPERDSAHNRDHPVVAKNGASPAFTALTEDILGHSSIATTGDIYDHVSSDVARQAMVTLGDAFDR